MEHTEQPSLMEREILMLIKERDLTSDEPKQHNIQVGDIHP